MGGVPARVRVSIEDDYGGSYDHWRTRKAFDLENMAIKGFHSLPV